MTIAVLGIDLAKRVFHLHSVDPQAWLADVLARLPDHPSKRISELLPWNWKAARLAATIHA